MSEKISPPAPADAPTFGDVPDPRLVLLPDDLRAAVEAARLATKDDTVFARIEAYEDRPGFVAVERGGADLQVGLLPDDGIKYLGELR